MTAGGSIEYANVILAAWCCYSDKGIDEKNEPLQIIDLLKAELYQAAMNTSEDALAFHYRPEIFGNLVTNKIFVDKYSEHIQMIYKEEGIRNIMIELISK